MINIARFRIEKVIRKDYKKKKAFVKLRGYSNAFNYWVSFKDMDID